MPSRSRGPLGRVASKIDQGTTARTRNEPPGPIGRFFSDVADTVEDWYQDAAQWAIESQAVEWAAIQILNLAPSVASDFFAHYLDGTGKAVFLDPVPDEWRVEISQKWKKSIKKGYKFSEPGKNRIGPYYWGNADLRNALGHFNLTVTDSEYVIEDVYEFYYRTDKGVNVRHGPFLTDDDNVGAKLQSIGKTLLPQKVYKNPYQKGTKASEGFEVVKDKDGWYFYLPTEWLLTHGKKFEVTGRFPKA